MLLARLWPNAASSDRLGQRTESLWAALSPCRFGPPVTYVPQTWKWTLIGKRQNSNVTTMKIHFSLLVSFEFTGSLFLVLLQPDGRAKWLTCPFGSHVSFFSASSCDDSSVHGVFIVNTSEIDKHCHFCLLKPVLCGCCILVFSLADSSRERYSSD